MAFNNISTFPTGTILQWQIVWASWWMILIGLENTNHSWRFRYRVFHRTTAAAARHLFSAGTVQM